MIAVNFSELLTIGFNNKLNSVDLFIIIYFIIDNFISINTIYLTNNLLNNYNKHDYDINFIELIKIFMILSLPLFDNINNLLFYKIFLKKKTQVINNILNYIKLTFSQAPNSFHNNYDIRDKYQSFTTSLWGFDSIVDNLINLISSLIKLLIITIVISYNNNNIGILILLFNFFLIIMMPKIDKYLIVINDTNYKKFYIDAYYDTIIDNEIRTNPITQNIQEHNTKINDTLNNIISKFSKIEFIYTIKCIIRTCCKNLFLILTIYIAYYQKNHNLIILLFINRNIIFGISDHYEKYKKNEISNNKNMEQLLEMLNFLNNYYKLNNIHCYQHNQLNKYTLNNLILTNLYHTFMRDEKTVSKVLQSNIIKFFFNIDKNIILIDGKTGCGKSLFAKIIAGEMDETYYNLHNDDMQITFNDLIKERIIINQKTSEEYTYNGSIQLTLNKLYPMNNDMINIFEIVDFLKIFNLDNKINFSNNSFSNKLSGGEKQRVILSSFFWKIIQTKPSYVIIDEPEKGLDESTLLNIMKWFFDNYKGLIILITHNQMLLNLSKTKCQSVLNYSFEDENEIKTIISQDFFI